MIGTCSWFYVVCDWLLPADKCNWLVCVVCERKFSLDYSFSLLFSFNFVWKFECLYQCSRYKFFLLVKMGVKWKIMSIRGEGMLEPCFELSSGSWPCVSGHLGVESMGKYSTSYTQMISKTLYRPLRARTAEPSMSILLFHDKTKLLTYWLFQDKCQLLCKASIDLKKGLRLPLSWKKMLYLEIINMSVTLFCHGRAEWT